MVEAYAAGLSASVNTMGMTAEQTLRRLLEMLSVGPAYPGCHYRNKESFLLEHGRFFEPQPLPKGVRRGARQQCFSNGVRLVTKRNWRYAEGYALAASLPIGIHHGWAVDAKDRVVDPTWADPVGVAYFGVVLPLAAVIEARLRRGGSFGEGGMLDDWTHSWPILQRPFRPSR